MRDNAESATPNLDAFAAAQTDDARLALGLEALRSARQEATNGGLVGWEEVVHEYIVALESGRGLNRPLSDQGECP